MYPGQQTNTVTCPHCQMPLMVAPGMSGQMVACSRCGRPLMMPHVGPAPGMQQPMMHGQMAGPAGYPAAGPQQPHGGAQPKPQPEERPKGRGEPKGVTGEVIGYSIFGGLLLMIVAITFLSFFFGHEKREEVTKERKKESRKTLIQKDIFEQARSDLGLRQIDKVEFDSTKPTKNSKGRFELSGHGISNSRPVNFTIEYKEVQDDDGSSLKVSGCKIRPAG